VLRHSAGGLDLERCDRRYQVRWAQLGSIDHLYVNLRIYPRGNGAPPAHVDRFDLYSASSRNKFAVQAGRKLKVEPGTLEDELSELLVAVDQAQQQAKAALAEQQQSPVKPEMTDAEQQEALALLKDANLMDRIAADMETLGYVGEETNKKLGYLVAVSRKLADPLSAIIVSQSGAGKSKLAATLERLVPPEEVIFWSRLTPQALYYVERDFLKRKLVLIEEREGSESADYSIRALQSKHKLVQAVPIKDPATGVIQTRTLEVDGPAAFLETTTRPYINPENASRCFELYLDESPAQTRRVHEAQRAARTLAGLTLRQRAQALERLHQNAQRLLEPIAVVVPYVELVTFPAAWLRTRRDHDRFLTLIEVVTFLHQKQRPHKQNTSGEPYVEATVEDYAIAYALAAQVLDAGLDEMRKPARDLLAVLEERARELAGAPGKSVCAVSFTQREVREWSGLPHHQVKRLLHDLEELEYVDSERSARGSRHRYRLVDDAQRREPLSGLLTPAALYNRLQKPAAASKSGTSGTTGCPTPKSPQNRKNSRT